MEIIVGARNFPVAMCVLAYWWVVSALISAAASLFPCQHSSKCARARITSSADDRSREVFVQAEAFVKRALGSSRQKSALAAIAVNATSEWATHQTVTDGDETRANRSRDMAICVSMLKNTQRFLHLWPKLVGEALTSPSGGEGNTRDGVGVAEGTSVVDRIRFTSGQVEQQSAV